MYKFLSLLVTILILSVFLTGCEDLTNSLFPNNKNNNQNNNLKGKLVFINCSDHVYGEIYTCNTDGSELTRISEFTNQLDGDGAPQLSPDGKKVLFRYLKKFELKLYDFDTKQTTIIGNTSDDAAWSPESDKIAYINFPGIDYQINICNTEGTKLRTTQYTQAYFPTYDSVIMFKQIAWHENGKQIVAYGIQSGAHNLYLIDASSGKIIKNLNMPIQGKFFYRNDTLIFQSSSQMYFHNLKDGTTKPLFNEVIEHFSLSPDGSRLAYVVLKEYAYNSKTYKCADIWACNLDGLDKFNLTQDEIIPDETKSSATFRPEWINNSELLFSAGSIYIVKDDNSPKATVLVKDLKAYGQINYIKK